MKPGWAEAPVLLVGLGLVAACNFNPGRHCNTSADCVNGGTCDVGQHTCVSAGAALTVVVTPPPARSDGGTDPGGNAWRRDELIPVLVRSPVVLQSVALTVTGMTADGGAGAPSPVIGTTPAPCPSGGGYCVSFSVDASAPELEGMFGTFGLLARATDALGSQSTATASVRVTRFRWGVKLGSAIQASPAVGQAGTVYVATADAVGAVVAVNPADGTPVWQLASFGPIVASPAVGAPVALADGGVAEWLYVADTGGSSNFWALQGPSTVGAPVCGPYANDFAAANAIGKTSVSGAGYETGVGFTNSNGGRVVSLRPDAASTDRCLSTSTSVPVALQFPSSVTVVQAEAFFGDSLGRLWAFDFIAGTGWATNTSWGAGVGYSAVGTTPTSGVALVGADVLSAVGLKGAFALNSQDGSLLGSFPDGGTAATPGTPSVGENGNVYFGDGAGSLLLGRPSSSTLTASSQAGAVLAAPVLGQGGLVYSVNQAGQLQVWDQNLSPQWSVTLNSSGFLASPNLDCDRLADGGVQAGPGVLYAASADGMLYAILVDSHGLDTSAAWPKYQHDSHNTGNPATLFPGCK